MDQQIPPGEGRVASDRNSLFIEISTMEDAIASRDRSAIALSLLCIFSLIGALMAIFNGIQANAADTQSLEDIRIFHFLEAGVNFVIIAIYVAIAVLISTKSSRAAALALLAFALFDASVFLFGAASTLVSAPENMLGIILGVIARFFIVVTSLNCLQGINAIRRFKASAT